MSVSTFSTRISFAKSWFLDRWRTDDRFKQAAVAAAIVFAVGGTLVALWMAGLFIPGPLGEILGQSAGILATPFVFQAVFLVFGFFIVIFLNALRRRQDSDEWVTREQLAERERNRSAR